MVSIKSSYLIEMAHALLIDNIGKILIFGMQPLKLIIGIIGIIKLFLFIKGIRHFQFCPDGKLAVWIPVPDLLKVLGGFFIIRPFKIPQTIAHEFCRGLFFLFPHELINHGTATQKEDRHHSHYRISTYQTQFTHTFLA